MNTLPIFLASVVQAAPSAPSGATVGGALGTVGLLAIATAIVGLVLVEFVWKSRLAVSTYRWLMLLGLLVLPAFAVVGSTGNTFEHMKSVEACGSCHVMNQYVDDMHDPGSASLAARHFASGAIPKDQCYACHTSYGLFGSAAAKRDGMRHWTLYATGMWKEPIVFSGSYPNANCVGCHAKQPEFRNEPSHQALTVELTNDRIACHSCHGLPHPSRTERGGDLISTMNGR
jgi:cytochrome c nitrite reductase small subunit